MKFTFCYVRVLSEKSISIPSLTLLSADHEFRGNCPLIFQNARPLGPTHIVLILEVGVQDQSVHWLIKTPRVPPENLNIQDVRMFTGDLNRPCRLRRP